MKNLAFTLNRSTHNNFHSNEQQFPKLIYLFFLYYIQMISFIILIHDSISQYFILKFNV